MHQIELQEAELDRTLQHRVRLHVRVDLDQRRNDEQKAMCGEYLLKVSTGVDVCGQTRAHHAHVLAVQYERAVDDAQEERNVPHGRGLRVHRSEHRPDELTPRMLVQHIGGEELTVTELVEELKVGLERLAH